ncbi:heavy-metal-associated domain-containing protein [Lentzea sp. NPDC059081]|uniref:heavy-metal-associated domain-containing protein n=1 Tax=Lentzea sp. NPDC059081 TaxID=3346719 RepID=UPI0036C340A2
MTETTFTVQGMTCGHCVTAVTEEVSALEGVQTVNVDLDSGKVAMTSTHPVDEEILRAAIVEAGYVLVA